MSSIEYVEDTNKSGPLCPPTPVIIQNGATAEHETSSTVANPTKCRRTGCENSSIDHPEWDGEYCSVQCLSVFCKEAFEQWVKKHQ